MAFSCHLLWAQRQGSGQGGGAGVPTHPTPGLNGQTGGPAVNTLNGSIYLMGNVALDDGTPPPESVKIERVCNGAPRAQAYTDQKGRFSFQIGQTGGMMQDASEDASGLPGHLAPTATSSIGPSQPQLPNAPDMQLANCDLRAVLSGFRSDTISLGSRRLLDDSNVGTIVLHRLANVEGSAVSLTSLEAPKEARKAYNRAIGDLRKEKEAEAAKALHRAVEIYPKYAAAWNQLGHIQERAGDAARARESYAKAIAADPKFISPYLEIAALDAHTQNWTALAASSSRLIKLDAVDYPIAYLYNALANLALGELDAAESSAREGLKLDTAHHYPKLEHLLATVLARKRDYAGAAEHLRAYLALAPDSVEAPQMRKDLAELDRLSGAHQQAKAGRDGS